uniref:Envelopment polyprotein n=1 Tax=Leanyer virus TaxID=999729 RepID=A0A513S6T6_9VIRU|nr:glycoprotein [Leanyer virus]
MLFTVILLICSAGAIPLKERCFNGGILIANYNSTFGKGDMCIKDDVSMIKVTTTANKDTKPSYTVKVYRLYVVKDWHNCNPIPDNTGTIQITSVSKIGEIDSRIYACRSHCQIIVDREKAEIVLTTDRLNHYEVIGTTIVTGWFKKTISIPLEHTCEELTIRCGQENLDIHTCFKIHRSCVRFFSGTYLPVFMIERMCQNIELIILIVYIIIAYIFAILITKSYIAYVLIPIFYPMVKAYSVIYNRFFKLCPNCLLALHPFSNCSNICICGSRFPSTESLRTHRLCKNCKGYKALTKTRYFCKNRLSSFILALLTGILLFSFITPVKGDYNIRDLPEDLESIMQKEENCKRIKNHIKIYNISAISLYTITILVIWLIYKQWKKSMFRFCSLCNLIHSKRGLTFNSVVTNKCGTCICGYTDHVYNGEDYEVSRTLLHQTQQSCFSKYNKKVCRYTNLILIIMLILSVIPDAIADLNSCYKLEETASSTDFAYCAGLDLNYTCSDIREPREYIKSKLQVTKDEEELMQILTMKSSEAFIRIESEPNIYTKMFLEHTYQAKQCSLLQGLTRHGGPANSAWRQYIRLHSLQACGHVPQKFYCQCIQNDIACDLIISDPLTKVIKFYETDNEAFKSDMEILKNTLGLAFQGMMKSIIDDLFYESTKSALIPLLERYQTKVQQNKPLRTVIMMTIYWLKSNFSIQSRPSTRSGPIASLGTKEDTTQLARGEENITSCESPKLLSCKVGQRLKLLETFMLCGNDKKIYGSPDGYTYKTNQNKLCLEDVHCHIQFKRITESTLTKIKNANCYITDYPVTNGDLTTPVRSCSIEKYGNCFTPSGDWPIAKCANGNYYYSESPEHSGDGNITVFCLTKGCSEDRFKVSHNWFIKCNWDGNIKPVNHLDVHNIHDFKSFQEAIKENIKTGLHEARFYITNQIPKVIPRFKSLNIKGMEYQNGIQNAFITSTIPVVSGVAHGLTIKLPDGEALYDLIIYIPKVYKTATYQKVYETGPTVSINMEHSEACTGPCPEHIPKKKENWLTFSKSKTSRWGCEELGCLAVGTGCVYGSCVDIIKVDSSVYKKIGEEDITVEVCITDSINSYCHKMSVLEPIETDKFSFTFESQTVTNMPELVYVKDRNVYTGQINSLGAFTEACGNIQVINSTVFGIGDPKFDYLCHAFKRKDIIIKKCMDNNYQSCKLLSRLENSKIEFIDNQMVEMKIHRQDINLGTLTYKVELGDVDYKLFTKTASISVRASCAGCSKCTMGLVCELGIESNGDTYCQIDSICQPYTKIIHVVGGSSKHTVKFQCNAEENVKITVCNVETNVIPIWSKSNDKIDVSSILEPTYIKEDDDKCETWLCKVNVEALNFISDFGYSIFGKYWKWFMITVISIICIFISIYILYPLCKRLKGCLEQNEKIYQYEMKQK